MDTHKGFRRFGAALTAALVLPGVFVLACSNDNANPQPTVFNVVDAGPTPSVDAASEAQPSDAGPPADSQPAPAQQDAGPEDAETCTSEAGCWTCTPTSTPQFLNQCTPSQCSPFNNAQRLPNYDGGLPPLH